MIYNDKRTNVHCRGYMKIAYIIENNLRVSKVLVIEESYGTCLVRFLYGGGMRINSKRLFATKEEAEKVLKEKSQKEENG